MTTFSIDEIIKIFEKEIRNAEYVNEQYVDCIDIDLLKSVIYHLRENNIEKIKVINGIKCHLTLEPDCGDCPYDDIDLRCLNNLKEDILTMIGADKNGEENHYHM